MQIAAAVRDVDADPVVEIRVQRRVAAHDLAPERRGRVPRRRRAELGARSREAVRVARAQAAPLARLLGDLRARI